MMMNEQTQLFLNAANLLTDTIPINSVWESVKPAEGILINFTERDDVNVEEPAWLSSFATPDVDEDTSTINTTPTVVAAAAMPSVAQTTPPLESTSGNNNNNNNADDDTDVVGLVYFASPEAWSSQCTGSYVASDGTTIVYDNTAIYKQIEEACAKELAELKEKRRQRRERISGAIFAILDCLNIAVWAFVVFNYKSLPWQMKVCFDTLLSLCVALQLSEFNWSPVQSYLWSAGTFAYEACKKVQVFPQLYQWEKAAPHTNTTLSRERAMRFI